MNYWMIFLYGSDSPLMWYDSTCFDNEVSHDFLSASWQETLPLYIWRGFHTDDNNGGVTTNFR